MLKARETSPTTKRISILPTIQRAMAPTTRRPSLVTVSITTLPISWPSMWPPLSRVDPADPSPGTPWRPRRRGVEYSRHGASPGARVGARVRVRVGARDGILGGVSGPARRKTISVDVGGVAVGNARPIVVQSMTNTDTADVDGTVAQVRALHAAGSE